MLLLGGCQYFDPTGATLSLVRDKGWQDTPIDTGPFVLMSFARPGAPAADGILTVYIEGDGDAFTARGKPTANPTPVRPVSLDMAMADPSPGVVYLGRPCQYTNSRTEKNCDSQYWSSHRFSEQVVTATDRAISYLKGRAKARKVVLVGFSGGGAIAALVAARRQDVERLVTVAGTLDHAVWTELHAVYPLSGSLNAADVAGRLKDLPQVHFVGGDDKIMPRTVADSYFRRLPRGGPARLVLEPEFGHECCWAENWRRLLTANRIHAN